MLDFETELNKLLAQQSEPLPQIEMLEIVAAERQLIQAINKKQTDISLQIEEIYDIAKDSDNSELQAALREEKTRSGRLVVSAVKLCDLIDDFYEYTLQGENDDLKHQALLMRKNTGAILDECGLSRFGETGMQLDPQIHSARSGVASTLPKEHVVKVLQSGYRYLGSIIRKAAVAVSIGEEEER